MEYDVVASKEVGSTQELGVVVPPDNPLNLSYSSGGTRQRTVGDKEMGTEVGAVGDSLGYGAWYTSRFDSITSTAKYVKVDDVDPLFSCYSGGALPVCSGPCPGLVTFPNLMDGGYPIWNIIRVITAKTVPSFIAGLIIGARSQTANYPDYVPSTLLNVFRSHYTQAGVSGKNGHASHESQAGGDVGGAVLTVQADLDFYTDTGKELTGLKQ
jgi:hypothetical protein